MSAYTARQHFLSMCDQSNWPDWMTEDMRSGYALAMESIHEAVMEFWPELSATALPDEVLP